MRIRLHDGSPRKVSRRVCQRRGLNNPAGGCVGLALVVWVILTGRQNWTFLREPSEHADTHPNPRVAKQTEPTSDKPQPAPHARCWISPNATGRNIARARQKWDITTEQGRILRRACVQEHIFAAHGLDTLKEYFMQGCDVPPMQDFQSWAADTGCGSEPLDGPLLVHTAWTGPYEHVREDLDALIDSFLMTQDLHRSKLLFWFLDSPVDTTSAFVRKYQGRQDAVEFRAGNLVDVARGTSMEGRTEFLEMNWTAVKKGPRWKANMFRVLVLHRYGGMWVDTDSVLLRDLRPMFEFAGEMASKLTMSLYYNNNVLGLRKGSTIAKAMVDDIVATPLAATSKQYCRYVGSPCYPKWTWNHGLIQLAVRQNRGIVIYPTTYTDPAYGCFPQWLLGKSGGDAMHSFTIREVLEFIRGAFVLHSRAYKTVKPIHPHSNYGRLYKLAAEGASTSGKKPVPLVGISSRNESEKAQMKSLFSRRGELDNVVDPPFVPRTKWQPVLLKIIRSNTCINAVRHVKGEMYGGNPELIGTADCSAATKHFNETVVFLWHPLGGYLRPAHREPGRVLCVDALAMSAQTLPTTTWNTAPKMITCNPNRPTQQWSIDDGGHVKNPHTSLCMEAFLTGGKGTQLGMRACSKSASQKFRLIPYKNSDMPYSNES